MCSCFNIVKSTVSPKCQQHLLKWNSCSAANTCLTLKTPLKLNTKLEMGTYRSKFYKLSVNTDHLTQIHYQSYSVVKKTGTSISVRYFLPLPSHEKVLHRLTTPHPEATAWSHSPNQQVELSRLPTMDKQQLSHKKCNLISGLIRWQNCVLKPWHHYPNAIL